MWKIIVQLISSGILKLLKPMCEMVQYIFQYLIMIKKEKKEQKKEELKKQQNEKIDDVCNNGSINDLINLGE